MFKFIILGAILIGLALFLYPHLLRSGRQLSDEMSKTMDSGDDKPDVPEFEDLLDERTPDKEVQ